MAQRIWRSDDSDKWTYRFGSGSVGNTTISADATDSTANTTITGSASGTSATAGSGTGFANGDLVIIHQTQGTGAGNYELNKISSIGAGTNWTMAKNLMNTYATGAQVYKLTEYLNYTINTTKTITAQAWNGSKGGIFVVLAKNAITITGTINAAGQNASGTTPGIGIGFAGGDNEEPPGIGSQTAQQGESSTGTGGFTTAANGSGGGGGHEDAGSAAGGGGGHATAGGGGFATGSATAGLGGASQGVAGLTTIFLGAAGGGAAVQVGNVGGCGGAGAGIVILIAPSITITGSINTNGGNGSTQNSFGGGGGAGGSVLLKGQRIVLGSGLVTASAGTQGTSGGVGSVGRIHADYSQTISGTTTPSIDSRQDGSLNNYTAAALFF